MSIVNNIYTTLRDKNYEAALKHYHELLYSLIRFISQNNDDDLIVLSDLQHNESNHHSLIINYLYFMIQKKYSKNSIVITRQKFNKEDLNNISSIKELLTISTDPYMYIPPNFDHFLICTYKILLQDLSKALDSSDSINVLNDDDDNNYSSEYFLRCTKLLNTILSGYETNNINRLYYNFPNTPHWLQGLRLANLIFKYLFFSYQNIREQWKITNSEKMLQLQQQYQINSIEKFNNHHSELQDQIKRKSDDVLILIQILKNIKQFLLDDKNNTIIITDDDNDIGKLNDGNHAHLVREIYSTILMRLKCIINECKLERRKGGDGGGGGCGGDGGGDVLILIQILKNIKRFLLANNNDDQNNNTIIIADNNNDIGKLNDGNHVSLIREIYDAILNQRRRINECILERKNAIDNILFTLSNLLTEEKIDINNTLISSSSSLLKPIVENILFLQNVKRKYERREKIKENLNDDDADDADKNFITNVKKILFTTFQTKNELRIFQNNFKVNGSYHNHNNNNDIYERIFALLLMYQNYKYLIDNLFDSKNLLNEEVGGELEYAVSLFKRGKLDDSNKIKMLDAYGNFLSQVILEIYRLSLNNPTTATPPPPFPNLDSLLQTHVQIWREHTPNFATQARYLEESTAIDFIFKNLLTKKDNDALIMMTMTILNKLSSLNLKQIKELINSEQLDSFKKDFLSKIESLLNKEITSHVSHILGKIENFIKTDNIETNDIDNISNRTKLVELINELKERQQQQQQALLLLSSEQKISSLKNENEMAVSLSSKNHSSSSSSLANKNATLIEFLVEIKKLLIIKKNVCNDNNELEKWINNIGRGLKDKILTNLKNTIVDEKFFNTLMLNIFILLKIKNICRKKFNYDDDDALLDHDDDDDIISLEQGIEKFNNFIKGREIEIIAVERNNEKQILAYKDDKEKLIILQNYITALQNELKTINDKVTTTTTTTFESLPMYYTIPPNSRLEELKRVISPTSSSSSSEIAIPTMAAERGKIAEKILSHIDDIKREQTNLMFKNGIYERENNGLKKAIFDIENKLYPFGNRMITNHDGDNNSIDQAVISINEAIDNQNKNMTRVKQREICFQNDQRKNELLEEKINFMVEYIHMLRRELFAIIRNIDDNKNIDTLPEVYTFDLLLLLDDLSSKRGFLENTTTTTSNTVTQGVETFVQNVKKKIGTLQMQNEHYKKENDLLKKEILNIKLERAIPSPSSSSLLLSDNDVVMITDNNNNSGDDDDDIYHHLKNIKDHIALINEQNINLKQELMSEVDKMNNLIQITGSYQNELTMINEMIDDKNDKKIAGPVVLTHHPLPPPYHYKISDNSRIADLQMIGFVQKKVKSFIDDIKNENDGLKLKNELLQKPESSSLSTINVFQYQHPPPLPLPPSLSYSSSSSSSSYPSSSSSMTTTTLLPIKDRGEILSITNDDDEQLATESNNSVVMLTKRKRDDDDDDDDDDDRNWSKSPLLPMLTFPSSQNELLLLSPSSEEQQPTIIVDDKVQSETLTTTITPPPILVNNSLLSSSSKEPTIIVDDTVQSETKPPKKKKKQSSSTTTTPYQKKRPPRLVKKKGVL